MDGSITPEGKALPHTIKVRNCGVAELHQDIRSNDTHPRWWGFGGPLGTHIASYFGLKRLIKLGYDYCRIIESDSGLDPGWFPRLMELFEFGKRDGFEVGALAARSIESRVMMRQPDYVVMWNIGAGMVLFARQAARVALTAYAIQPASSG